MHVIDAPVSGINITYSCTLLIASIHCASVERELYLGWATKGDDATVNFVFIVVLSSFGPANQVTFAVLPPCLLSNVAPSM